MWLALLALLARYIIDRHSINNDVALYLNTGQLILHGKWPYVDFVDVNPPLIMYLSTVPAAISDVLPLSPIVACNVTVWALLAISTVSMRALLRLWANASARYETALLVAWLWVNSMIANALDWGQREHLFVMLYIPFLLLRTVGGERRRVPAFARGMLGAGAALGALLKPGFLVLVAVPELYWMLRRRRRPLRSVETASFIGVCVTYAAHFLLLPAAVRHALFAQWLPLISRRYNSVYSAPWRALIFRQWVFFLFLLAVAGLLRCLLRRRLQQPSFDDLFMPLGLIALASTAYYLQQHKGWAYQAIPIQVFAALALALVVGGAWDLWARSIGQLVGHARRIGAGVVLLSLLLTSVVVREERPALREAGRPRGILASVISNYSRRGDRLLFISTSVEPAYPLLLQVNREPGSRFLWMFPIALFEAHRAPKRWYKTYAELSHAERQFVDEVDHDIVTLRPRLIFVASFCQGCPTGFDLNQYIESTGIRATAMASYTQVRVLGLGFYRLAAATATPRGQTTAAAP